MPQPILFFGEGGGGRLFEANSGTTDAGTAIAIVAESDGIAPAGVSGECVFTALYLGLTWSMGVTLRITPILNGVRQDGTNGTSDERRHIILSAGVARQTRRYEMGLSLPLDDATGTEYARVAMRGVWFAVLIESIGGLAAGDLIVDIAEVEYDVVQESETPQAA